MKLTNSAVENWDGPNNSPLEFAVGSSAVLFSAGVLLLGDKAAVALILALPLILMSVFRNITFSRLFMGLILAIPAMASQDKLTAATTVQVFGLNFTAVELMIFLLLGTNVIRSLMSGRGIRNDWSHIGLVLLVFSSALVAFFNGVFQGYPFQRVGVDFRSFVSILLYFPLRRAILLNPWRVTRRTITAGILTLWWVGILLVLAFKNFIFFMNSGGFSKGTLRLLIINSYPETILLSSLIIVRLFIGNERKTGILGPGLMAVALIVVLNIYGSRNLLFVTLLQIPMVFMVVVYSRKKMKFGDLLKTTVALAAIAVCIICFTMFFFEGNIEGTEVFHSKIKNAYDMVFSPGDAEYRAESVVTRIETSGYLWRQFSQKPFLGFGFGYLAPLINYAGNISKEGLAVDNLYLYLGLKQGLIGLFVFLILVGYLVFRSFTLYKRDSHNQWGLVFLAYGISILVSGIFSSTVVRCHAGWLIFAIWIAFLEKSELRWRTGRS